MVSLPNKQKAVLFDTKKTSLSFTDSAPIPDVPSELLIKVHSTAITNGELTWAPFCDWPVDHVPCYDVSGTVITSPDSRFKPGDKVFGRVDAKREGTARQYANILPSEAAHIPDGLNMLEACSVPMSAHTAWQALFEQGLLTGSFSNVPYVTDSGDVVGNQAKGKRVLILGAAGGVGLFAVQFTKLAGATVYGTASAKNEGFLKSIGIDAIIDYTKTSVESWAGSDEAKRFDLVLDCVGGKSMLDGWHAVREGGVYVSIVPGFKEPPTGKPKGARSAWFVMYPRGSELEAISKFITKGLLKTWVDSVWNIEQYDKAFAKTATGHARGKVVLKIADEE